MAEPERDASARNAAIAASERLRSPAGLLDACGNAAHLNAAWKRFAGLGDDADVPADWNRLVHADDRAAVAAFVAGRGRDRSGLECRLLDRAAHPRWFALALHCDDGEPAGDDLLCTATDVHAARMREDALRRRASAQADMLDISADCIKLIDLDGRLSHMNKAGCLALGVPAQSGFGMPWLPLLPEGVREAGRAALDEAIAGASPRFTGCSVDTDGSTRYWDNLLTPVLDASGRASAVLCVSRDVTAEREAVRSLQESEERLSTAARVGGLGVWDYDILRDRLHCDASWYRIMGREPEPPIASVADFRPFIHPEDAGRATEVMRTATELVASGHDYSIAYRIVRPGGEVRWVRSLAHIEHRDGVPVRAVGFVADVTGTMRAELALREANRMLQEEKSSLAREVLEDPLTGIANRRHLDLELARLHARAAERGEPLCLGLIDVDHFKQFNDLYGHLDGDAALRGIAAALRGAARQCDVVARYGGEEFAFVLPGTDDPTPMLQRFQAAIAALSIPHAGAPAGQLTISCGAVASRRPPPATERLFRESDEALYEAKLAGRDRYVVRFVSG